jgi:hypothetical protein
MAEASGTTFLDPDDGALMLDADGSVRLADGVSDDCCCGGCPEGCTECGECCFANSSKLRITIEWLICLFTDPGCTSIDATVCYKATNVVLGNFYVGVAYGYPANLPNWSGTSKFLILVNWSPASCEYVTPTADEDIDKHLWFAIDCTTGHWWMLACDFAGTLKCETWVDADWTDLGAGNCNGLTMTEFTQVGRWGCGDSIIQPRQTRQVRVTIEVIDNDDCMAV